MSTPWVHSFSVTETQLYERKFTIYRLTSIIFPAQKPGALSCVTIWKRFSDVKDLHQKLTKKVKREGLAVKLPTFPKDRNQFFNRFNNDVIESRRKRILELLDFIGQQPSLYSCDIFTKFLQTGYTPHSQNIPIPPDNNRDTVDGGCNWSESISSHTATDLLTASDKSGRRTSDSEDQSSNSIAEDQVSIVTTTSSQIREEAATLHHSLQPRFSSDYVVEASERFNEGVQLEVNDRYEDAVAVYKDGIEILMTGIRSESDPTRRKLAKEKAEKYLSRSENIYELFLKPHTTKTQPANGDEVDSTGISSTKRSPISSRELPLNQLAKYKVIRVLGDNVLSVQEVTTRRYFIIKSIDRTEDWTGLQEDHGDLAYMVTLVAYFVTEFVVFLLLQPACGGRLVDYIDTYGNDDDPVDNNNENESVDGGGAPAFETMSSDVDIEELLASSQKLLNSVQKTLDDSRTPEGKEKPVVGMIGHDDSAVGVTVPLRRIPETCLRQWAKELIVAVDALHERNIILGHLCTGNLLLGKSGQLLLTYYHYRDFTKAISKHSFTENEFLAPDRPMGVESDWYSVGMILYELLTGHNFGEYHPGGVSWYFELQCPEDVQLSTAALSLLRGLLVENPKLRFGFTEICSHPFFYEADLN